jgi:hypothetical protein
MDNKKPLVTDAQMATVIRAADVLLLNALDNTDADPSLAIGALSLALATACVLSKIPVDVLVGMITMQYTNQNLAEAARLLQEAQDKLVDAVKPPKTDKDLN